MDKLHSLTEIVNFQDMSYLHEPGEYVLLPKEKQKIIIDIKREIYFEILLDLFTKIKMRKKRKSAPVFQSHVNMYIKYGKKEKIIFMC